MTTPHQLPIDRAFVIGGETADGSTDTSYPGENFGQNFTEEGIRGLFEIPAVSLGNMVEVFTNLLLRIPLEALKIFEPIIPGGVENFTDVLTAVNAIVGSLTEVVVAVPMSLFQAFLDLLSGNPGAAIEEVADLIKNGLDSLESLVQMLLGIFGIDIEGTFLDQIFDLVDGFDEWLGDFDLLQGGFGDLAGRFEDLLGQFFQAFSGGIPLFETLDQMIEQLLELLNNIPFLNILGIGGPDNIGGSITTFLDNLVSGFVGVIGGGAGFADVFNVGQEVSSNASRGSWALDILGIRNNKTFSSGMLATSHSSLPFTQVATGSPTTVPITQSTALTLYDRIQETTPIGVIRWYGSYSGGLTHFFVNIYKMDTTTGVRTLVHASDDILGSVSSVVTDTNKYVVPVEIIAEPTEVYGYEIAIRGAGTYNIVGETTWVGNDPDVFPQRMSSVRNSGTSDAPTTIAHSTGMYSSNLPFIEAGISVAELNIPHAPLPILWNTAGSHSQVIPPWVDIIEVVGVGNGGAGAVSGSWGFDGDGGSKGNWNTTTWTKGVHFNAGDTIYTTIPGRATGGGLPKQSEGPGDSGGNVVVTLNGHTLTCTGGGGGSGTTTGSSYKGQAAGNQVYGGITYLGGLEQATKGSDGTNPGGGGAGGPSSTPPKPGGDGGLGAAWARMKQAA